MIDQERRNHMDLFEYGYQQTKKESEPLAARMRPRHIDEVIGQQHIIGPGKLLRRMIEADRLSSIILYGPPGTGKNDPGACDRQPHASLL